MSAKSAMHPRILTCVACGNDSGDADVATCKVLRADSTPSKSSTTVTTVAIADTRSDLSASADSVDSVDSVSLVPSLVSTEFNTEAAFERVLETATTLIRRLQIV